MLITRESFVDSTICVDATREFQKWTGSKMEKLSQKGTLGNIVGRVVAPLVYTGALITSLILRIASMIEPILVGIVADIVLAIKERQPVMLAHILYRPVQLFRNIFFNVVYSGKDLVFVGSGALVGIFAPTQAYKNMQPR